MAAPSARRRGQPRLKIAANVLAAVVMLLRWIMSAPSSGVGVCPGQRC
jgi:hypothetical protein